MLVPFKIRWNLQRQSIILFIWRDLFDLSYVFIRFFYFLFLFYLAEAFIQRAIEAIKTNKRAIKCYISIIIIVLYLNVTKKRAAFVQAIIKGHI